MTNYPMYRFNVKPNAVYAICRRVKVL
jgi:hypothetical protein